MDLEELCAVDVESSWVTEGSPPISVPVITVVELSELPSWGNALVCDSTPTPDVKLPVDPCDVEVPTSESDPRELAPVAVSSCKLLGVEVDVCPPPFDALPIVKPVDPTFPRVVS